MHTYTPEDHTVYCSMCVWYTIHTLISMLSYATHISSGTCINKLIRVSRESQTYSIYTISINMKQIDLEITCC